MKVIIKKELKGFLKNPIYYAGILLIVFGLFQILQPYLKLHYWENDAQVASARLKNIADADIMDGYLPATEEEQIELALPDICRELRESLDVSKEETDAITEMFLKEKYRQDEISAYLIDHYSYTNTDYYLQEAELRQGSAEEVNAYMEEKFGQMRYSEYFARKFADFAGLFFVFFSAVLMAFLFLQDTRKNTYELLHTKPVLAWQYVLGKIAGGFLALLLPLALITSFFTFLCLQNGKNQGFPVAVWDLFGAAIVYILPNLLMVICVYALTAFIFKNPLPATPLLILYMVYSNMGSIGPDGQYGYYGRPLAIIVRFPGLLLDTSPPPLAVMNQTLLLFAAAGVIWGCIKIWKKRRV